MFTPINRHVEVEPIVQDNMIVSNDTAFEEKGVVVSVAKEIIGIPVGATIFFDSWTSAKFPDKDGKIRYLVQEENIRAIEQ
jgi:hypothetical protein